VSPRGTLAAMDDYHLWVSIRMGYFEELAIEAVLAAGPGRDELGLVAGGKQDVAYPSPGVLAAAVDRGVSVLSIWGQYPAQVFDFSLPLDSPIASAQELAGKTVSVPTSAWKPVVDPLLVEAGVDPASVELVEHGAEWNLAVAQGKADAGLAWEGLRAQLVRQGLKLRYLLGPSFSAGPSNVYAVRHADLDADAKRDAYARFLQGVVMGLQFAQANPRAAAQIAYRDVPGLAERLGPQTALEALVQLAAGYGQEARNGNGFGFHDPNVWDAYLETISELGYVKRRLAAEDVLTNDFVEPANSGADAEKAREDAEQFELDDEFAATTVPEDVEQ
jgi:ABC-type nitrate/sulfonate/bicarbonate transport system substrate-binding protein